MANKKKNTKITKIVEKDNNTGIDDIDEFDSMLDVIDKNNEVNNLVETESNDNIDVIDINKEINEINEIKESKDTKKKNGKKEKKGVKATNDIMHTANIDISRNIEKRDEAVVKNLRRVISSKRKEEIETSILLDIKNNKVLWMILGGLIFILIIAMIVTNTNKKKKEPNIPKETTTVTETTTVNEEDAVVEEPADSPITELIKNFLKAQRIDVSLEEVSKYVDNSDKISVLEYEKLKKYIEEYQNVSCYKLKSTVENTYIVITTYGCKFYNIETAAPGFEVFMVVNKDGKYLIHNLTVEESIDTYISRDVDVTRINKMMKEINDSLENAKNLDDDLAAVMNELSSIEKNDSTETTKNTEATETNE